MSAKTTCLVISFPTTADAMAFEHHAGKTGFAGKLIPVPHNLSTGCGMAWRSSDLDTAKAEQLMKDRQIEWEELVLMEL